jgi:hypothetical protein
MDSLLNLLAPQDHIPLGITWVASWLLELAATLFDSVPLDIIMVLKDQLPRTVLIEGCNLYPTLSPIGQLLLHHLNLGFHLVIHFTLCSGHDVRGGVADC